MNTTEISTLEGDKAIAIFMKNHCIEGVLKTEHENRPYRINFSYDNMDYYIKYGYRPVFKYHSSWDELMPVVEKIKEFGKWTLEPGFAKLELYRELGIGKKPSKHVVFTTSQMNWETEFDEPVEWIFLVYHIVVQFLKHISVYELKTQVTTDMPASTSLVGCPFHYCDKNPKCDTSCRYLKRL